jgi:hypothetical protein
VLVRLYAPKRLALAATWRPADSRQRTSRGLFTARWKFFHQGIVSSIVTNQVFNQKILSQIFSAASSISRIALRNKSGRESERSVL